MPFSLSCLIIGSWCDMVRKEVHLMIGYPLDGGDQRGQWLFYGQSSAWRTMGAPGICFYSLSLGEPSALLLVPGRLPLIFKTGHCSDMVLWD